MGRIVKTFENWKQDRAEMEMRKSGEEIMKKAAEKKAKEEAEKAEQEECDKDDENCEDEGQSEEK